MFDDAASSTIEVVCHPRCGSVAIVKKGRSKNGEQRYLCQDCGRTFGMGGERILRTSKLPRETWMAHAECFVLMLPLRECARRCHVRLKTACTMLRRLIGCLSAYSPSFKVERGRGCELDKTYFPESFRGIHAKGSFTMPRPFPTSRQAGPQARAVARADLRHDRRERLERDVLRVSWRGIPSRRRATDVLRGRIMSGSVVATDKAPAYADVLAELEVAAHAAYGSKDRPEGTVNRINAVHSLLGTFMEPFRGVSTKHLDAHLAWFKWCRTLMATDSGTAGRTVARQLANGVRRSRIRDTFNVLPPYMDYWGAPTL